MGVMDSMKNRKPLIIGGSIGLLAVVIAAVLLLVKCPGCDREPEVIDTLTPAPTEAAATEVPGTEATETPAPTDVPAPTDTPEPYTVRMRSTDGFVKACSTGTYGVATDGSIRFIGRSVSGQNLIWGWSNIIDLELNDQTTAGLRRDGTLKITGAQSEAFAEALEWTGIVDLAMGKDFLAGLRTDGTAVICGASDELAQSVSGWHSLKKLAAGDGFIAGLTDTGVYVSAQIPAGAFEDETADIAAAGDRLALLLRDGRVRLIENVTDAASVRDLDYERIAKIFVSPGAVYAIDDSAKLFTDAAFVDKEVTDAYCVAASEKHAVILKGSGKCVSFGENKDMQCSVGNWRLMPFLTDEGYLIGYGPGTYMGSEVLRTGYELTYVEPATRENVSAVVVVMGDANGDGQIDDADVNAVKDHISGKKRLTGPFLRAANVIDDSAKPGAVDSVDLARLSEAAEGIRSVDRYAKTDKYTTPLANMRRRNKDALGYIKIRNTNIDYPIMYDYNWFYNDHDPDGNSAVRGSIYFYWERSSGNIVITGHNARSSGTMFHQLHKVQDNAGTLRTYSDRLWPINTYGQTGYWEVWAMYEEGAFKDPDDSSQMFNTCWPYGFNRKTEEEKQAWIDYQLKRNKLGYTVNVTTKDRFLTLVTCGDSHADAAKGARLYFFLRLVGND